MAGLPLYAPLIEYSPHLQSQHVLHYLTILLQTSTILITSPCWWFKFKCWNDWILVEDHSPWHPFPVVDGICKWLVDNKGNFTGSKRGDVEIKSHKFISLVIGQVEGAADALLMTQWIQSHLWWVKVDFRLTHWTGKWQNVNRCRLCCRRKEEGMFTVWKEMDVQRMYDAEESNYLTSNSSLFDYSFD